MLFSGLNFAFPTLIHTTTLKIWITRFFSELRFSSQITKMLSSTICVKTPETEKKKCVAQQVNFIQKVYSETTLIVVPLRSTKVSLEGEE